VIVRGIEKRQIVDDAKDRENFTTRMGTIALETATTIYAWALMTNAHCLLQSGPQGIVPLMRRLLTGYAAYFNKNHKRHEPPPLSGMRSGEGRKWQRNEVTSWKLNYFTM
jgi:hypothetical protein